MGCLGVNNQLGSAVGTQYLTNDVLQSKPVHMAACSKSLEVLQILIDQKVVVDRHDEDDWTPLVSTQF